jgi:SAM-dependent methyltransferase
MPAPYDPIAELYDGYPGNYAEDIVFFAQEAVAAGGPVLELGAGTGRLSLCLAAVGSEVVGLDLSVEALRVLRRRQAQEEPLRGQVWPIAADMRQFALRQQFPLAIVPFRTFLYLLTREDQERALRAIRAHLTPGGKLILAFFVPPPQIVSLKRTPTIEAARFPAPEGEGEVVARSWTEFEPDQRFVSHLIYEWRNGRDRVTRTLTHALAARYIFPEEMPPLLERCGYVATEAYGGFQHQPLDAASTEQIWTAEAVP